MTNKPLSKTSVLGYAFSDVAYQMIAAVQSVFVVYFLYNYSGVSGTAIALVILIAGFWDAINDPLMGILCDRTNTKMGKARPYLLFGPVPLAICIIALFFIPGGWSVNAKAIWMGVAYLGYVTCRTIVSVPYGSMMVRITDNRDDRMRLTRLKSILGSIGGVAVMLSFSIFAAGKENEATIIAGMVAVFAVVYIALNWFCFFTTKEIKRETDSVKVNPWTGIMSLLKNKYWVRLTVASLAYGVQMSVMTAVTLFYVTSVFHAPDLYTPVVLVSFVAAMTGALTARQLEKKFGQLRKVALLGGMLAFGGSLIRVVFMDANVVVFLVSFAIAQFGYAYYFITAAPFSADTVEYGELSQGIRVEALASSSRTFADKIAATLVASGTAFLLDVSGYIDATTGGTALVDIVQPDSAMTMLFVISAVVPLLMGLVIALCMKNYNVREDIDKLREEKAAAEAAAQMEA